MRAEDSLPVCPRRDAGIYSGGEGWRHFVFALFARNGQKTRDARGLRGGDRSSGARATKAATKTPSLWLVKGRWRRAVNNGSVTKPAKMSLRRWSVHMYDAVNVQFHPRACYSYTWKRTQAQPLPPHAKNTKWETNADGGFHDAAVRFARRQLAAGLRCGCTEVTFGQITQVCRLVFLPECRQRCCLLLQRRSLTGIAQLLLAVPLQAGAGRCGAVCGDMQPVCARHGSHTIWVRVSVQKTPTLQLHAAHTLQTAPHTLCFITHIAFNVGAFV